MKEGSHDRLESAPSHPRGKNIDQLKVELMADSMTCKNNLPWASITCNSCVAKDHQNSLMTQQCHVARP
jgi:hypothetical protein